MLHCMMLLKKIINDFKYLKHWISESLKDDSKAERAEGADGEGQHVGSYVCKLC